jgi:preprotein translocase SecE subunit
MANSQNKDGNRPPTSIPIPKSKRGMKGFATEVGREMKKVNWPSRAETNRLTGVVFAVCFLLAAILTGMSVVFDTLIRIITSGQVS